MSTLQESPILFTNQDVEITRKETLYKGFFALNRYYFRHKKFDGSMTGEVAREIFERGHAVALLPYDPVKDEVILIEQIRIAALESSRTPWLLEVVAGMIETGESFEDVARRETEEEAGVALKRCQYIMSYLASPGGTTERTAVMIGEVDASRAKGIHGLSEENEDIKVHVVNREQAYRWIEEGIIDNAATIIALQWLQLNYHNIRTQWNKCDV